MVIAAIANNENGVSVRSKLNSVIDRANSFDVLTSNRIYYVRPDGNDSNSGLFNTAGGAFLTIMKAVNTLASAYGNGFSAEIFVADGTYTTKVELKSLSGYTFAVLTGNVANPGNAIISVASDFAVVRDSPGSNWQIRGFRLDSTSPSAILAVSNGVVDIANLIIGTSNNEKINISNFGRVAVFGNITFTTNAIICVRADRFSTFIAFNTSLTFTSSPTFTIGFDSNQGSIFLFNVTWTGSFIGVRHRGNGCAVFSIQGASPTYIPGTLAGTLAGNAVLIAP